MKVIEMKLSQLTPYENNVKEHPPEQVEQIKQSILQYGMNDPIAVWGKNNLIVEGHGRYEAMKELGEGTVPVIRLDHLSDEQRRAYTIVHNKLTMNSGFDIDALNEELRDLDIDLSEFDIEIPEIEVPEVSGPDYYGQERERTGNAYNLWDYDVERTAGFYEIPTLKRCDFVPKGLIGFNYVLSTKKRDTGVHFFLDDYQFERVWNQPQMYLGKLAEFDCVLTPDFSLYLDMPMAMKIWNTYRSRMIGQIMQQMGLEVIPTLSWAEEATYSFCFDGIEPEGVVAVSTVGIVRKKDAWNGWCAGMDEAMRRLRPSVVLCYGTPIDYDFGNVPVRFYKQRTFRNVQKG